MNDKIDAIGATILYIVLVLSSVEVWHQLRLESTATEYIKEASAAHDIERRVLELETRVAELERTARK